MSHRTYSQCPASYTCPVVNGRLRPVAPNAIPDWQVPRLLDEVSEDPDEPKFQQVTTPSGLTLEVLPPRPRSLVPLIITTVLLWSAVGAVAWLIYTHLTAA